MSGGVDSSVSAALLKEQGYDVTGVFIKVWQPPFLECNWRKEREDAMRVAAKLGIDFKTFDLSLEYKREVADYMISEYAAGRTPNPDVMCNKKIKFGGFFKMAMDHGAELIATGHYAQTKDGRLLVSKDTEKDQTYFLWDVSQEVFEKTLFPIGEFEKTEVRALAKKYDLFVADKKDSQGVCFLGQLDMREFLKHYIKSEEGNVLTTDGEIIGTHEGALFYTLGQRHGFTITKKTPNDDRYFVVAKDTEKNTLTVSHNKKEEEFAVKSVSLSHTNWIGLEPEKNRKYMARFRYRQKPFSCEVREDVVVFDALQSSIASGQSIVLYDGDACIGGGVIE